MSGEIIKMKHRALSIIIAFLVVLSPFCLQAQTDSTGSDLPYQIYAYSAPQGVMLVIIGDWIIPQKGDTKSGYHIYKKENASDSLVRINAFPLNAPSSYSDMVLKVGQGLDGMFSVVGVEDSAQFWQLILDQDESIAVWGTMFKKFRQAMGLLQYDYDVEVGKTYTYVCAKTDESGVESAYSQEIIVTAGTPLFNLLGPLDIQVQGENNQATISWRVNPDDSAAFSYNVYRAYDSLSQYVRLNSEMLVSFNNDEAESELSFVDTLALNGRQYYYAVVSVDFADNESLRDNIVSVFPQDSKAPSVPKNIRSESGSLGIKIVWEFSPENDLAGYSIYRAFDKDSTFEKLDSNLLPMNLNYYEDVTAQSGDEYFYRLTAVDQAGNESEQSANIFGFYINPSLPLPPMNLKAIADSGKINLSWSKIEDSSILGYYMFRASSYKGEFTQISDLIPQNTSVWTDTSSSLSSFSTYYYAMKSSTLNGNFSYYNEAVAVNPIQSEFTLPQAPSDFYGYADYSGIRLQWKMPLDKTVFGYNLYRKTNAETAFVKVNDSVIIFSTTTFLDTVNIENQVYTYYIKSTHFEGLEGDASHSVEIYNIVEAPEPPNGVRAIINPGTINIKWDSSLLDGMKGYNIYKHTGEGSFVKINNELLPLGISNFIDKDITSTQKYYYTITTVSKNNRESFHSTVIDVLAK